MRVLFNKYAMDFDRYSQIKKPPRKSGGLNGLTGILRSVIPSGMDTGDILLLLILFFLYNESKDEDFLIILAVVAMSILSPDQSSL